MFQWLIDWTERTLMPYGSPGLFAVSLADSAFSPVPPDIFLLLLILVAPENWLLYAVVTIVGSILGAMLGYYLGWKFGLPILRKFVKEKNIKKVHKYFEKYEVWAVGIGAFTPLPYKIFTVSGGIFYINFKKFMVVSIIGRTARYIPEAYLMALYGHKVLELIEVHFFWFTIVTLAICGAWMYFKPPE